jgi:hypothetical protein
MSSNATTPYHPLLYHVETFPAYPAKVGEPITIALGSEFEPYHPTEKVTVRRCDFTKDYSTGREIFIPVLGPYSRTGLGAYTFNDLVFYETPPGLVWDVTFCLEVKEKVVMFVIVPIHFPPPEWADL